MSSLHVLGPVIPLRPWGIAGLREAIPHVKTVLQTVRHALQLSSHLFARIPHIKAMRFVLFLTRHAAASDVLCLILMAAHQPTGEWKLET